MKKYTVHLPRSIVGFLTSYNFDENGKACLISITEPGNPEVKLMGPWTDILRVAFWDVTTRLPIIGTDEFYELMTESQAKVIAEFIKKHENENIIVHCLAGKSRSAAVVRLLTELGWKMHPTILSKHDFSGYNIHVYSLLKKQFPELLPEGATGP